MTFRIMPDTKVIVTIDVDTPAKQLTTDSDIEQFVKAHFESSTLYRLSSLDDFALEPYRRTSKVDQQISKLTKDSPCPEDSSIHNPASKTAVQRVVLPALVGKGKEILN